ncbi:unnamed protein product, partial [Musa hybrid cultivar]
PRTIGASPIGNQPWRRATLSTVTHERHQGNSDSGVRAPNSALRRPCKFPGYWKLLDPPLVVSVTKKGTNRKRRVASSSSYFSHSPRVRFRLPTKKRSPRNTTAGLGFGPVLAGDGGGSRGVGSETNIDWESHNESSTLRIMCVQAAGIDHQLKSKPASALIA